MIPSEYVQKVNTHLPPRPIRPRHLVHKTRRKGPKRQAQSTFPTLAKLKIRCAERVRFPTARELFMLGQHMKYPQWQKPYLAALMEVKHEELGAKVAVAEAA